MFRFSASRLKKIAYATLFSHNYVLKKVFEAPGQRVALVEEVPGLPVRSFSYGQLQRDVITMSNVLLERRVAVQQAQEPSAADWSWSQPPRDPKVQSVFSNCPGNITPSCDVLEDNGSYVTTLLTSPGYHFVVGLLASWALNLLVSPMSISQQYRGELTYVLEHSGARMVLGDTAQLHAKIPPCYDPITVSTPAVLRSAIAAPRADTYCVDTVMDMEKILKRQEQVTCAASVVDVECLPPSETSAAIRTAEDVERRLEEEKQKKAARDVHRQVEQLYHNFDETLARNKEVVEDLPLQFESDTAETSLNALFLRWYTDPSSRPTQREDCLMIYTSGTTARPKGTVHSHASIQNQVTCLQTAWKWTENDVILHMLPLHHIHGLVNVLLCALASQARCVFTRFDNPSRVARRIEKGDISLVMAVPTIYTKMMASIRKDFSRVERAGFRSSCLENVRLMVSGSAALPVPTLEQFRELSGHTLLERYGMTEIGMALSQPLRPIEARQPGAVGSPLPTVEAYVQVAPSDDAAKESGYDAIGTLAIASASLFDRYWRNPDATHKEVRVDANGKRYFDTGDTVGVQHPADPRKPPVYTILGRSSVDIIKHSGYKLSALEIEAALLSRKDLFYEMAVVGSKDEVYGESVVAVVAMQPTAAAQRGLRFDDKTAFVETPELTAEMMQVASELLAKYKRPSRYLFVREIPRNPTGKVNKKSLKKLLGVE